MNSLSNKLTVPKIRDLASLLVKIQKDTPPGRIVEPLLDLLVGSGQFDLKQNFLIREPNVVLLILELLPTLPDSVQLELWSTLGAILHQCLPNATACHHLGLTEKCLEFLSKTKNNRVAGYIISVLEMLAGYSLSVKQLKGILSYLYNSPTDESWARYSVLLIGALCNISVGVQPDVYFSFSGGHGAVLTLPPLSRWPGQSGFTISTWIRAEKPFDQQRDYYKPIVYWFRTGKGLGYSAHFIGSNLVLETVSKNSKRPQTHSIDYIFHSYQWHMVTISYQYHRLKSSELNCYVDGSLQLSTEVTLPPHDERYDKCFLGGNHVATPDSVFQGQIAALYVWRECLNTNTISALYKLGPSYKSQFKFEAEVDMPLTHAQRKLLFDRSLSNSMVISYNAKAVDGQLCLEASPAENESFFVHSPHATMLEGVDPIITTSFHSALHSLGGIQAFFPFFSQLDSPQITADKEETAIDHTLSVKLLSMMFELARNSITYMYQIVQMKALELIANLLEKVSPLHLTEELLSAVFDFLRYLSDAPYGEELLLQLIEHLLMNSKLWKRANKKIQIYLYSQLATEFCMQPLGGTGLDLRDIMTVSYLVHSLKEHYSLVDTNTGNEEIRQYVLLIIKQFTTRGKGIDVDELSAVLNYLASVPEEENLFDVFKLLVSLMFEDSNLGLVKLVKSEGGIEVAVKLLTSRAEELRINALKVISKAVYHSTPKEQSSLLDTGESLLVVIKEKLLSSGQIISIAVFNTLIELMLNSPSKQVIETRYIRLTTSHKIAFISVLQLLIELICTLNNSQDVYISPRRQLLMYMSTLCSQNTHNCSCLLNLSHWLYWLFKLDVDEDEGNDIEQLLQPLMHTVLMYALSEEEEGWRVWVESGSTLHSYMVQKGAYITQQRLSLLSDPLQSEGSSSSIGIEQVDSAVSLKATPPMPRPHTNEKREEGMPSPLLGASGKGSGNKKMPRFVWSLKHRELLRRVLVSVKSVLDKSSEATKFSDSKRHSILMLNTLQIIVLSVDSLINLVGGVKSLVSESCNVGGVKKGRTVRKEETDPSSPLSAQSLLRLCVDMYQCIVYEGTHRFSVIEARMNMDVGGVLRQTLRTVLTVTSLDCVEANRQYLDQQLRYNSHKQLIEGLRQQAIRLLKITGTDSTCLDNYVQESFELKLKALKDCQALLSEHNLSLIRKTLTKDSHSQQLVSVVVYYLAVMCVAKYKSILDSIEKEKSDVVVIPSPMQRTHSTSGSDRGTSPVTPLGTPRGLDRRSLGDDTSLTNSDVWEDPNKEGGGVVPSRARCDSQEGSVCSSLGSASDLHHVERNFLGSDGALHPPTVMHLTQAIDVSEQVNVSLKLVGLHLCQLIAEHRSTLAKVLATTDGRQLLSEAAFKLAESGSIVEITMLLCSQEWQSCLQKTAGKHFGTMLAEGKQVSNFSEAYMRSLASDINIHVQKTQQEEMNKFTNYEEHLSVFLSKCIRHSRDEARMRRADVIRHALSAEGLWRQISTMVDQYGFYDFTPLKPTLLWRLDTREDSSRRRMKLLPNPRGSMHTEAIRSVGEELTEEQKRSMYEPEPAELLMSPLPVGVEDDVEASLDVSLTDKEEVPQVSFECGMVILTDLVTGSLSFRKETLTFTANDPTEETINLGDAYPVADRWSLEDITAVFSRRYLHQSKALEVFFVNKSSVFLVFADQREVKQVVNLLPKVGIGPSYGLPQSRSVSLMTPDVLLKRSDVTDKWMKGLMSNFDYLMSLNTLAGRSFNDLSQYPVFPWILKDYTSDEIDLKDPNVYRDLSKPIGAQDPNRRDKFQERFESWESDVIPAFHYGTHYSNLAFVVHWLVRIEPFTSLHVNLHDGFFDHGSRLFSSIARAWNNCQKDSSDVKELVPELFYLPEMLTNENKFMLGYDEHGEMGEELPERESRTISDVLLPPWAKSAEDFVTIHRQALESDHVSANLHQWIDLIFGYKQTGKPAEESINVFYYLTYLGSVNWKALTEEKQLKAIEQQILQFGQTPYQLLKESHPPRQAITKEFPPQPVSPNNPAVIVQRPLTLDVPIGLVQVSSSNASVLSISYNQLFAKSKFNYIAGTTSQPPLVSIDEDPSNVVNLRVRLGDPLDDSITSMSVCLAATPTVDTVFMCGFWDSSFKIFSTDNGQLLQSVFGHRGVVTCVSYSQDEGVCSVGGDGIIATGSHDVTVLLWKWSGKLNRVVSQLKTQQGSVTPLAILNGHERTVTCVALSATLGLVASGTKNGCCLLHSISGELLHKLVPSSSIWRHPHMIVSSHQNRFIVHYADQKGCLTVFNCNGKQLAYRPLNEPALGLAVTSDGNYIVFGGFSGRVYVLNAQALDVVYMYEKCDSSIRALSLSTDNRFIFAGLSSGTVVVLATHFWRQ